MSGFLRTVATRVAPTVRATTTITQRATLMSRPAKDKTGPVETVIGLGMFALAILGPSGWVLAHLEEYKKKD